LQIIKENLH
jgi:hypothetical protein